MILFPRHPLYKKQPDLSFQEEVDAAEHAGFKTHFIDIEDESSFCHSNISTLYRGWIVTPAEYHDMFVQEPNLIVRPEDYNNSYNFPQWYEQVRPHSPSTPKSVWFPGTTKQLLEDLSILWGSGPREYPGLGNLNGPIIIKDWCKSRKHEWLDACYIPDILDSDNLHRVVSNFLNAQGESLAGGLVCRECVQLKPLGVEHPKSHIPLFNEHRFFIFRGQIFYSTSYWNAQFYGNANYPKKSIIVDLVRHIKSEFFAVDVAEKADGGWIVIEINDGSTAGILEGNQSCYPSVAYDFYDALREVFA